MLLNNHVSPEGVGFGFVNPKPVKPASSIKPEPPLRSLSCLDGFLAQTSKLWA